MIGGVVASLVLARMAGLAGVPLLVSDEVTLIEPGDVVRVTILAFGDPQSFTVLPDGTISGAPFGSVRISGLSVDRAADAIRDRSKRYILNPVVFVTITQKRESFVTVVGLRTGTSKVLWTPETDLRSVVVIGELNESYDRLRVNLFRDGVPILTTNVAALVSGDPATVNPKLKPDDVVTITPSAQIKVWATGRFRIPGETSLPEGATLTQAVAAAGGAMTEPPPGILNRDPEFFSKTKIRVVRGGKIFDFPFDDEIGMSRFVLESGDTLMVNQPRLLTIDIAGEVLEPGVKTLMEGADLIDVLVRSKGPTEKGTLENVLLFRDKEIRRIDLSAAYRGESGEHFLVENGDLVIVQENLKAFTVLGDVRNPGKFAIRDKERIFLTDALSKGGGLTAQGTLRRVMVARPQADGKYFVQEVNIDEFLKDGKGPANIELFPGDFVYFSQARGINGETFLRLLPIAFLLPGIIE